MTLRKQHFDSKLFERQIATLELSRQDVVMPTELPFAQFDLIQAKVPSRDGPVIDQLTSAGFKLCEGEIELEISLDTEARAGAQSNVGNCRFACRHAKPEDIPELSELAATSFEGGTRFRRPWYTEEEARLMYSTWVAKAVRGEFDDICLMIEDGEGGVLALVTLGKVQSSDFDIRIGLLAVRDTARKQGLGGVLLGAATEWALHLGKKRLRVATQISNMEAIRLYVSAGAKPVGTSYWLYK